MALQNQWEVVRNLATGAQDQAATAASAEPKHTLPVAGPFESKFAAEAWIAAQADGENLIPRQIDS